MKLWMLFIWRIRISVSNKTSQKLQKLFISFLIKIIKICHMKIFQRIVVFVFLKVFHKELFNTLFELLQLCTYPPYRIKVNFILCDLRSLYLLSYLLYCVQSYLILGNKSVFKFVGLLLISIHVETLQLDIIAQDVLIIRPYYQSYERLVFLIKYLLLNLMILKVYVWRIHFKGWMRVIPAQNSLISRLCVFFDNQTWLWVHFHLSSSVNTLLLDRVYWIRFMNKHD